MQAQIFASKDICTERLYSQVRLMAETETRCLVVENNFLISLDLVEILRSLGFGHIDQASDKEKAIALLQNANYDIAFIDFDQGEGIARQIATQMRLRGGTVIFTSTILDHSDMPSGLGEFRLLPKPYSTTVLRDILELK